MKLKILLGALLLLMFTSEVADAQRYHRRPGYGYRRHGGYYRRGPAVVIVPPRPVIVNRGYYGPGYRRGYYGRSYRRGHYYDRGYRRGYYARGPRHGYRHRRW